MRHTRSLAMAGAGMFLFFLAEAAAAQGRKEAPIQSFRIIDFGADLFSENEMRTRRETRSSGGTTTETQMIFQQGVDLKSRGYVYHPNLVDWNATLRLGANEQMIDVNGRNNDSTGSLLGYDLSALILQEKPISFDTFASSSQSIQDRNFARLVEVKRERQGIEMFTKGDYPMLFHYDHATLEETGDLRDMEEETHLFRFGVSTEEDEDFYNNLSYEHEETDSTSTFHPPGGGADTVDSLPITRDDLNYTNRWIFGQGDHEKIVTGRARAMQREGFFPNTVLDFDQRLDWEHSDTLASFYGVHGSYDETETQTDQTIGGEAGVTKKLYDSLELTGRTFMEYRDFGTGSEKEYGGSGLGQYRKETPIGKYLSSLSAGLRLQEEESSGDQRLVRDEPVTLVGLTATQLSRPNVVAGSVTVTNLAMTVTYVEGTDYTLSTLGAFTEITRLGGGGIAAGETVLVSYITTAPRNAAYTTTDFAWTHRLELKDLPLAFLAEYRLTEDHLINGEDPGNLDSQAILLGGVELTLWKILTTYEHEIRDQNLSPPTITDRLRSTYRQAVARDVDLSLGAHAEYTQYLEAERFNLQEGRDTMQTIGGNAALTTRINRYTLLRFTGDVNDMQGRDNGMLAQMGAALEWRLRDLSVSLTYRHEIFEQEDRQGEADMIMLNLHRRF
ncbi:MAG: hypothetical protein IT443_11510 [Phycisphaeraceae bacterium]|nr:hypothetical protein [Phycisphaeraceae bacterium]